MADRTPLISGNWKMNLDHHDALRLVQQLHYKLDDHDFAAVEVSVHPPFTDLRTVQTVIDSEQMKIRLGAQNCYHEKPGAFTGEVSSSMLAKLNVSLVIVGHSERRALFGETNEVVNHKAKAVIAAGMVPIVCVGESADEREGGQAHAVVTSQVTGSLQGIKPEVLSASVIAYEPVWAIGTGKTATAGDAQDMCATIRGTIASQFGSDVAGAVRIQYGGSVKPGNAGELMACPDIDGALVGGASLVADDFVGICGFGR